MVKRLLVLTITGLMLSGCFMAPLALIGPAASGFSSASIIQSGSTTAINFVIKKITGKTLTEHAFDAISSDVLAQTYMPKTVIFKKKNQLNQYHHHDK